MWIVSVTGACGSGKSYFSQQLKQNIVARGLSCEVLESDHYYHDLSDIPEEKRRDTDFCQPQAIDFALLVKHIQMLRQGFSIERPNYVMESATRQHSSSIKPCDVLIVEGILIHTQAYIMQHSDITVFMDMPLDICLARRLERDAKFRNLPYQVILDAYPSIRHSFFQHTKPIKSLANLVLKNASDVESALYNLPVFFPKNELRSKL